MLAGVHVVCFVASYLVALVLELLRGVYPGRLRAVLAWGFAAAGLLAQSAYLYYRAIRVAGTPLSSQKDWYFVAAWIVVVVYLYLAANHPRLAFGVFLLPIAVVLIGIGALLADAEPFAREPASQAWGLMHGASILLASVSILLGFVSGLMYLIQARRLKKRRPPIHGFFLPSLEWLKRINYRSIGLATLFLGIGILSGMVLIRITRAGESVLADPLIVGALLLFGWLVVALIGEASISSLQGGRRVAYLTVVGLVFLLAALTIWLTLGAAHGQTTPTPVAASFFDGSHEAIHPIVEITSLSEPTSKTLSKHLTIRRGIV